MIPDFLDAYVPCESFEVTVQYGPEDVLSPMEIEFIYAINSGFNTLQDLVDLYKLGNRPTFDLLSGLWKADYIYVDLRDGTLYVNEAMEKQVRSGKLAELNRTEVREKTMTLMQDLVTGAVLPMLPNAPMRNTYRIVPQLVAFGSYVDIPKSQIADLAVRHLLRRNEHHRPVRVLGAYVRPRAQTGGSAVSRRLMQLRLQYGMRHDRPVVEIASPPMIDGQVRRGLEKAIGTLVQERPDDAFCRQLLQRVREKNAAPSNTGGAKNLESLMDDLGRRIESLRAAGVQEHLARHQTLETQAALALEALGRRRASGVRARLLHSPKETVEAMSAALQSAASQIVLCSPRATWAAAAPHWNAIERAVTGGASLFLLSGDSRNTVLDKVLERNLAALAGRHGCADRVHWSRSGLGTNESFMVTDRKLATLATFSLLDNPQAAAQAGLGVQFESRDGSQCAAIEEIFERVRRNSLEHAQARAMEQHQAPLAEAIAGDDVPAIPDPPGRSAPDVYLGAWQAFLRELQAAAGRLGDCAEMVFDGTHRQVLMQALEDRPQHIVLGSGTVSPDALTMDVVKELKACVQGGARVTINYRGDRHMDGRSGERLEMLSGLANLRMHKADTAGGVIATEKFALLSGFPILGLPGFLLQETGQRRLEGGVLIHGAGFARQVADALDHSIAQAGAVSGQVAANGLTSHDLRLLQQLMNDSNGSMAASKAASLALNESRWGLFTEWVRCLTAAAATRAVAALLAQAGSTDLPQLSQWRTWLVRDRWQHLSFVEAALLLEGQAGDAALVPTPGMARAAAATGMPHYSASRADLLAEAMDDGGSADHVVAWICIASTDLLVHAVPDASDALEHLAAKAPPAWAAWCASLLRYWREVGQPLPMERFEALRQGSERLALQEEARADVLRSIEAWDQVMQGFHFALGKRSWEDLSAPTGWVGMLRAAVEGHDAAAASLWLGRLGEERKADPESMLQEAEHRVYSANPSEVRNKRIDGPRRTRCLTALKHIMDAVRQWVAVTPGSAAAGEAAHHLDVQARALGTGLRGQLARIEADPTHADIDVARPVYQSMKRKLEVLWTRS